LDEGKVIGGELVITGCNAATVLDLVEEALANRETALEKLSPRSFRGARQREPGIQNIGISCVSGFRVRPFGPPRKAGHDVERLVQTNWKLL
jgi:hypothetical protein